MGFADVLLIGLQAAVPLRIHELCAMPPRRRSEIMQAWRADAVDAIGHRGDALQFGGKRGQAAAVFNDLARGLAVLAHAPGGVQFAGLHWCLEHPNGKRAGGVADLACSSTWPPVQPKTATAASVMTLTANQEVL